MFSISVHSVVLSDCLMLLSHSILESLLTHDNLRQERMCTKGTYILCPSCEAQECLVVSSHVHCNQNTVRLQRAHVSS